MDYAKVYTQLHEENPKAFAGNSIKNYVHDIASLVHLFGAKTLLDYGSGKGYQYLKHRVHEHWGGILPYCYDVGVRQLSEKPEGTFDGVICTDVMEHIEEQDVDAVLRDIFGYSNSFVFFCIACRAAKKKLPDGRNAHLTIQPPEWWEKKLFEAAKGKMYAVVYDTKEVVP